MWAAVIFLDFFASYRSRPPCETISHVDTVANNYGSCIWVALYRYTIFHALSRQEFELLLLSNTRSLTDHVENFGKSMNMPENQWESWISFVNIPENIDVFCTKRILGSKPNLNGLWFQVFFIFVFWIKRCRILGGSTTNWHMSDFLSTCVWFPHAFECPLS
jgi:hypothetical protein